MGWLADRWNQVKGIGRQAVEKVKTIGRKAVEYVPKVIDVGRKALDVMEKIPFGIGTLAGEIKGGIKTVEDLFEKYVPEGRIKDNIKDFFAGGKRVVDKAKDKSEEAYNRYVKPVVDTGRDIEKRITTNNPDYKMNVR